MLVCLGVLVSSDLEGEIIGEMDLQRFLCPERMRPLKNFPKRWKWTAFRKVKFVNEIVMIKNLGIEVVLEK